MKDNGLNRNVRQLLAWMAAFFLLMMVFHNLKGLEVENELPYSTFKAKLRSGDIKSAKLRPDLIRGEYKDDKGADKRYRVIPLQDPKLIEEMELHGVKDFSGEPDRSWVTALIINLGWVVLFFFLWWVFVIRQMQVGGKQAMFFGKSKAKLADNKLQKVTFKDVAGCDEAKEELHEIIEFLKDPKKFQKLGAKIPKGVLLYGPPGTGKTLLAKAVAGEAGVPFYSSSGSEFVEMFVGVGASRVRDLFEQARKSPPALIFVDELDAVGRHRFAGIGGGHDEREQTLNQILVELDGFDTKEGIILVAATNRPDVLDPALLRPGRFDRHINVPPPDQAGREAILRVHAEKVKLVEAVDLKVIARRTPGFVGADLANLVNEAALLAARKNKAGVEMKDLEESIDRVMAGPQRKSRMISDNEKKVIAYHESGHTLVAKLLPGTDPVHKVTIIPRGPALGYTLQLPTEDRYLTSRSEIRNRLCVLLGGRVAEELVFKEITTGAHDDLAKAMAFAQRMVTEFGMSDKVGPLSLKKPDEEVFLGRDISRGANYSEDTARMIDEEVKRIIIEAKDKAVELLAKNRAILDALATKLVEREILEAEEIDAILQSGTAPA